MSHTPTIPENSLPASSHYALLAARTAIASVSILIGLKIYAYAMSGSASLLGTLVDSFTDAGISLMMFMAIKLSAKPADKHYRYGRGKVQGLAALFQAAFLGGSAVFLGFESLGRLAHPQEVSHHWLGIGVAAIAMILSLIVVGVQSYALKKSRSLAVSADQSHYKSDIFLNAGVIVALFINLKGGPLWIDTLIGLGIALYIALSAFEIGKQASDMLMDRELPDDVRLKITGIVEAHKDVCGMHDLRTRWLGTNVHISFDVELEPTLTLQAAHDIVRTLELAILEEIPHADIIIHMDPKGDIHDARHRVQGVHH